MDSRGILKLMLREKLRDPSQVDYCIIYVNNTPKKKRPAVA